jgi:hypothetical protein
MASLLFLSCLWIAVPATAKPAAPHAAMGERLQTLNRQILADRDRASGIAERYLGTDEISEDDFNWLKITAEKYGLEPRQRGDQRFFTALLDRIDVVPPSLALALGWLEYGWRPRSDKPIANGLPRLLPQMASRTCRPRPRGHARLGTPVEHRPAICPVPRPAQ